MLAWPTRSFPATLIRRTVRVFVHHFILTPAHEKAALAGYNVRMPRRFQFCTKEDDQ